MVTEGMAEERARGRAKVEARRSIDTNDEYLA